ncbi:hypothetical protein [Nocardia sp. NPDC005825]|uniref:hypothetical protein n=1 Tax=unclassified Nocardia TaxID=2637762 RepID=UPI0033C96CB5
MKKKFIASAVLAAASAATILGTGSASADETRQIHFAYGTDNGFVSGHLQGFDSDHYKLDARGGQTMIVSAAPYWSDVVVTVKGPTGTLTSGQQWAKFTLPVNGSYELVVTSPQHRTLDYGLGVKID